MGNLMRETDGLSLLRKVRELPHHATTPVVVMSTKDYDQDRAMAKQLGALEYLIKPVRSQVIREVIEGDPRTDTDKEIFLQVNNLGDSSVDFLVRAWVSADDYFGYQADIKRTVKEAFDANGIDIPFPTRTLVRAEAEPEDRQDQAD